MLNVGSRMVRRCSLSACRQVQKEAACIECPFIGEHPVIGDIEDAVSPTQPRRPRSLFFRSRAVHTAASRVNTTPEAGNHVVKPTKTFMSASSLLTPPSNANARTFHRRPLPPSLIRLSSPEGKALFKEACEQGTMENYWPLSEQFLTQSEPALCSVTSLAMVLNALGHDPNRTWRPPWRWVTEELLTSSDNDKPLKSLSEIESSGLDFHEFSTLITSQRVRVRSVQVDQLVAKGDHNEGLEVFRSEVERVSCDTATAAHMIINFSRERLGQTGDGHYSPIGGYNKKRDMVLLLDVARFKYPPHWVRLEDMYNAMTAIDQSTGAARGWFLVSRGREASDVSSASFESCPALIERWAAQLKFPLRKGHAVGEDNDLQTLHG